MNKLSRITATIKLIPRLGVCNVLAVAYYRYQWRRGALEKKLPARKVRGIRRFFEAESPREALLINAELAAAITMRADKICEGKFLRFAETEMDEGEHPNWHKGVYAQTAQLHFTHCAINAVAGEDVKLTWDLSRMQWAPRLALAACITTGEARNRYLQRLNQLMHDWSAKNPYQTGVNWACSQEVAVRGMHLMVSHHLLSTHLGMPTSSRLSELLAQSWQRVFAVRGYARAQQNNHSLTEHLFLIYAAEFLARAGVQVAPTRTLEKLRKGLTPLIDSLITEDGGSALYSSNYHRVFCDVLSYAKLLDDSFALGLFNHPRIQLKSRAAYDLLNALIEPVSGQMPMFGNNDGSLHCLQYSAFERAEPSLLFMAALFGFEAPTRARRQEDTVWLFGYPVKYTPSEAVSHGLQHFDAFGLSIYSYGSIRAYVKYPRNRYRPAQCDFGHFDLWVNGKNILHDGGTYSYNPPTEAVCMDLAEMHAHNTAAPTALPTICKLSAFLYAIWPNTVANSSGDSLSLGIALPRQTLLTRHITFSQTSITLTDHIATPGAWEVNFHGDVYAVGSTSATLGNGVTLGCSNAATLRANESSYAPNYHRLAATKRLTVTPRDMNRPVITTISIES